MEIRNIISVRQLILNENSELQEIQNPKTGKHFFCCGSKRGFLTPNAVDLLSNQDSRVDDFVYAEVKKDNSSDWVSVIYPNPQKQAHNFCNKPLEVSNVNAKPGQPDKNQFEEQQTTIKNEGGGSTIHKARVFRIFKDNKHTIPYVLVSPAKCRDDVESVNRSKLATPMMEIRLHRGDNTLEKPICVWASPDVVKRYTGFDIFNQDYEYLFEGKVLDIEFEWTEGVYPYGILYDSAESLVINVKPSPIIWYEWYSPNRNSTRTDYVLSDKVRFPRILKIKEVVWGDDL